MKETVVIYVDYESPPAHRVARDIWRALSRAALNSGFTGITARWESLQDRELTPGTGDPSVSLFIIGQDRPEMVERLDAFVYPEVPHPYGIVVATPERPSPLAGSLLYQGMGRLTREGVRARDVLPALVPVSPKTEGEAYAARLFERVRKVRELR